MSIESNWNVLNDLLTYPHCDLVPLLRGEGPRPLAIRAANFPIQDNDNNHHNNHHNNNNE